MKTFHHKRHIVHVTADGDEGGARWSLVFDCVVIVVECI